jgi:hypothetical protein
MMPPLSIAVSEIVSGWPGQILARYVLSARGGFDRKLVLLLARSSGMGAAPDDCGDRLEGNA